MNLLLKKILDFVSRGNERSILIKKNILGSFLLKCISILISLQIVPLTINYINPTRYGIWLTLSSIIAWLSYFDLGFAHGFRNRFAEAKALGNYKLAKEYVSTTYAVLAILFFAVFILSISINHFINWSDVLNVDISYKEELRVVFGILACFFCLNIVASVFTTLLTADQKPALSSLVHTCGQVLAFVSIYILTKTLPGNLEILAFAFSGVPCSFLILISIITYGTKEYKDVSPSLKFVRFDLVKNILGLGGQFFLIMISMLFIFQFINIILSRVVGPEAVTQYNIVYKYFHVLYMIAIIVLTPCWSAFTDAYVKKDFVWMRKLQKKLEQMWLLCLPVLILMVLLSNSIYRWWIGDSVEIPFTLSVCMAIYILCQISCAVYMYLINGIGKVRLQMITYIVFALLAVPLMNFFCERYDTIGVLIVPTFVFAIQAIIGKVQLNKIINNKADGIWFK